MRTHFRKKKIQISCLHIQEKSQQLIISSSTETDVSQNSDSSSYISFPEVDDNLQQSCQSLCDQEGSWDVQSKPSSYYSTSEVLFQDEVVYSQSENSFLQQQYPLNSNASMGDYIKKNSNSVNFQSYSPSTYLFSENTIKEKSSLGLELEKRYEHEDDQPSDVKEEGYTLDGFSDDCGQLVENYVSDGFKENFNLLVYNEKEEK